MDPKPGEKDTQALLRKLFGFLSLSSIAWITGLGGFISLLLFFSTVRLDSKLATFMNESDTTSNASYIANDFDSDSDSLSWMNQSTSNHPSMAPSLPSKITDTMLSAQNTSLNAHHKLIDVDHHLKLNSTTTTEWTNTKMIEIKVPMHSNKNPLHNESDFVKKQTKPTIKPKGIVPIPFVVDRIIYQNYFHALQYFSRGLVNITHAGYDLDIARDWKMIRLVWNGKYMSDTTEISFQIGQKIFEFFDGRFDKNGVFHPDNSSNQSDNIILPIRKDLWKMSKKQLKPLMFDHEFWTHSPIDSRINLWFQTLAEHKFGIPIKKYPRELINQQWSESKKKRYCLNAFKLRRISVLLISRDTDKRRKNLTDLALTLKHRGKLGKITHVPELGVLSVKEQARLFATHLFSVQPHGAGMANLMFVNTPFQTDGPPHIAIELSNPYISCLQCRKYGIFVTYRKDVPWQWTFTVSNESPTMDCNVWCNDIVPYSPILKKPLRIRMRNPGIPASIDARNLHDLIQDRINHYLIPHCLGEKFNVPTMDDPPLRALTLPFVKNSKQYREFRKMYLKIKGEDLPPDFVANKPSKESHPRKRYYQMKNKKKNEKEYN